MTDSRSLPGAAPYVLREGEGLQHLVAGQVIRTLAGVGETAGGFGAVVCDCPLDRGPIPMHWHEKEHDTWFVTRGKLQVWCDGGARILSPGDFAYVKPGGEHSYRSIAPRTRFFGVVAPGGWEQFFADAGEVYGMTALPPADRPFDFTRMGPAMGKHRIMRVDDPIYVDATPIGEDDQAVPEGEASFFLEAGFGTRRTLLGHLSTAVLPLTTNGGLVDMRTIEGGRGAATPTLSHRATHQFLYVLDGVVALTLGGEEHRLTSGDAASIPAGASYGTRIVSGSARWIATSSGGDGGTFWDAAGEKTPSFSPPIETDAAADEARLRGLSGIDLAIG